MSKKETNAIAVGIDLSDVLSNLFHPERILTEQNLLRRVAPYVKSALDGTIELPYEILPGSQPDRREHTAAWQNQRSRKVLNVTAHMTDAEGPLVLRQSTLTKSEQDELRRRHKQMPGWELTWNVQSLRELNTEYSHESGEVTTTVTTVQLIRDTSGIDIGNVLKDGEELRGEERWLVLTKLNKRLRQNR